MNKRLITLLLGCSLLLSSFALAACGSSDDSTDSSGADTTSAASQDESEVESVIVAAVTSDDPAKCTESMTPNFVDQSSEASGQAALEECEEEAAEQSDDPDEVEVSELSVKGSTATGLVAFGGSGPFANQTVEVSLVEKGGWKLDEIVAFTSLDKDALAGAFEEQFAESSDEITPEQASCFGDAIRDASKTQIEQLFLQGNQSVAAELAAGCL